MKEALHEKAHSVVQFIYNYRTSKSSLGEKSGVVASVGMEVAIGKEAAGTCCSDCNVLCIDRGLSYAGIAFVRTPQIRT